MQFPSHCKNRTDRNRCSAVSRQQLKFSEIWGYFLPWYRLCTNRKFIFKGSYGCGEPKNAIYQSVQKRHRSVRVNKLPRFLQRRIGQAIEIFKISGLPIVMVPCLHQCSVYIKRKLRVWRAQKCNFQVSVKTARTDRFWSTNYHVSCSSVLLKEQKISKFWSYQSSWYRICTNATFILKRNYGCGEPKNAIYQSVHKPHRPERVQRRIAPAR